MMRYIFPPHPDKRMKIRPESVDQMLEGINKGLWVAERKYNGSQFVAHYHGGEVNIWNRHGEPFTTYKTTPAMVECFRSLNIPPGMEVVLNGELLHTKARSKITERQAATDTIVLYDLLYFGKYILTLNYLERYNLLKEICRNPEKLEPKKRALEVVSIEGSHIWLAETFTDEFSYHFYEMFEFDDRGLDKYPEIEGLVLKKIDASSKLKLGNIKYDVDWMIRVRKTKEKIYLF